MKKQLIIILLLFCATSVYAQKMKLEKGALKNLKEIKEYSLQFDYSNLEIPKYNSEEDFLIEKMNIREEKEPGSGEIFKNSWFADRENRYEPKFIESFNKRFENGEIKVDKNLNTKYSMLVKTSLMYPGYNVGVWRQNSKIEATITVSETNSPDNILFSRKYTKIEGLGSAGYDFDSGYRISEAYAKLAKEFAENLKAKALN